MSAIASPPSAIIVATSTTTRPRSCLGMNERRARAFDSSFVRPVRSASSRTEIEPACATTPVPSAVTDMPPHHELRFTYGVPLLQDYLDRRKPKFSLQDRHFRAFHDRVSHYP